MINLPLLYTNIYFNVSFTYVISMYFTWNLLLIYICKLHWNLLLIYICKLHWNLLLIYICELHWNLLLIYICKLHWNLFFDLHMQNSMSYVSYYWFTYVNSTGIEVRVTSFNHVLLRGVVLIRLVFLLYWECLAKPSWLCCKNTHRCYPLSCWRVCLGVARWFF